jgi:hypothetical protein
VDIAGLKRILEGSVRFTQPSAFNDPFELLPEVVVPNDAGEKQLSFSFDIRAQRRQPPPRRKYEGTGALVWADVGTAR